MKLFSEECSSSKVANVKSITIFFPKARLQDNLLANEALEIESIIYIEKHKKQG